MSDFPAVVSFFNQCQANRGRRMSFAVTPIRVECAWCGAVLTEGREPVSHGICPGCAATHFPKQVTKGAGDV